MEWLFIWLVCAILTACVAGSKGRSPMGWLFVGLLGGIFALLAVGFMPAQKEGENEGEDGNETPEKPSLGTTSANERKCPYCAEMIKAEAIVCRYCGRDVEPVVEEEKPQEKPHVVWPCPHCGAECADHKEDGWCHSCKRFFDGRGFHE